MAAHEYQHLDRRGLRYGDRWWPIDHLTTHMTDNTHTPSSLDDLLNRARIRFPDIEPAQLKRVMEQSFHLNRLDDHGLAAFVMTCSMKIGIPVSDVVQVLALSKMNLMGQQYLEGTAHPDDI